MNRTPTTRCRVTRCGVGVALAALTMSLLATVTAQPPAGAATPTTGASPRPGGQSAGDSLFPAIGNTGYDVANYAVSVHFAAGGSVTARTVVTARAPRPLSSFSLDLQGLRVDRTLVDGRRATFTRHDHKLVVRPSRPVSGVFRTTVDYHGRPVTHIDPDGSEDGWVPTADGATVVSEPVGAMTWFPDNNTPRDKATYTVRVTAPSSRAVAGNGDLRSRRTHEGRTTWTWVQRSQMATYLAMISIGRYHVYHAMMNTATGRRLPVWSFVQPKLGSLTALRTLVPKVVRFEERRFGRYPFSSVGIVVKDLGVGYALETQNRPVFDGTPDTLTLVHELAHQWYGDSVTPRVWEDVWLNEGFATYAESLWTAAHGGPSTAVAFHRAYQRHGPSSSLWRPAPARFGDPADLFGAPVYDRGSMTLEALRERVGSRDFFALLRRWATVSSGRSVTTPQFVALAERLSHRNLGAFFRAWLYVARKPAAF